MIIGTRRIFLSFQDTMYSRNFTRHDIRTPRPKNKIKVPQLFTYGRRRFDGGLRGVRIRLLEYAKGYESVDSGDVQ